MSHALQKEAIKQLLTEARTHHAWKNEPVSDAMLHELYEITKWGPTSVNGNPMRVLFIKTDAAKEKLYPTLMGSNVEQVKAAPVTVVVAYDTRFFDHINKLFPAFDAKPMFEGNAELAQITAFRNSSMQGAYMLLAARSLGLDVGPMSGFDNAKLDEAFFAGTTWKSNFIFTLGHGDNDKLFPRGPRLTFDEACKMA